MYVWGVRTTDFRLRRGEKIKETREWDIQLPPALSAQSSLDGTELGPRKGDPKVITPSQDKRLNSCSLNGPT